MTATAIIHRDSIIEQLAQGRRLGDIAPALGVIPNAISKALKKDPEYRDAIEAGFHKRLDVAEDAIEQAQEMVDVARARARFQSVAWRAEREFPEVWSQKSEIKHSGDVQVDHSVGFNAVSIIEQIAVVPAQHVDALRITDVMSSAQKQQASMEHAIDDAALDDASESQR